MVICQSKWQKRRPEFAAVSLRGVVIMTCCTLFEGFTITGVDNSAHVGGLIFGLIFAFLLAIKS